MPDKDGWAAEKKAYIRNTAPMLAPKREGGRVIDGYEQTRLNIFNTHLENVNTAVQLINNLPVEGASVDILKRIIEESTELKRQLERGANE